MKENNIDYYEQNADQFISGSLKADMSQVYNHFLEYIPNGGYILDAGCGSGRDSLYFIEHSYNVTAFDASEAMVNYCRKLTGLNARQATFNKFETDILFDGIWACASLLHIPQKELIDTIERLSRFLKEDGLFYLSFKMRDKSYESGGRSFTCFTKQGFQDFIQTTDLLKIKDFWTSEDARPGRKNEMWVNALLVKI